jgi:hypothetical protein
MSSRPQALQQLSVRLDGEEAVRRNVAMEMWRGLSNKHVHVEKMICSQ